ncbi:MAG: YfcC family protein [Firmicutes bacterium]|nr:YfcC family protein [Bacillota bacterium]
MNKNNLNDKKKGFKLPDTYVIVAILVLFVAVLTYIVPAGVYDTVTTESGRTMVDATTYHEVEKNPVTLQSLLFSFYTGLKNNASMIFFVMLVGGYFEIALATTAIQRGLRIVISKMKEKAFIMIPIVMIFFAILGATGVLINAVVAFIPLGLAVAQIMKLDRVAAMAFLYLGTYAGFNSSFMAASSVQIAQEMAELPLLSGMGFRVVVTIAIVTVSIIYVMRYCLKVNKDPAHSIMPVEEYPFDDNMSAEVDDKFTARDIIILLLVFGGLALYVFGCIKYAWGYDYMAAIMLISCVISGFVGGMNADQIAKTFVDGTKKMVYAGFLIGLASCISILLTEAQIIHTIIYYISMPLVLLPKALAAVFMFIVNLIFNFFVSSASGQAAIVMPIMVPMADVLGISRQVAVLAYQYGDGFSNCIIPTSGVLMASLGVAKVPFEKWLKFMLPLFFIWTLIGCIAVATGVLINLQ